MTICTDIRLTYSIDKKSEDYSNSYPFDVKIPRTTCEKIGHFLMGPARIFPCLSRRYRISIDEKNQVHVIKLQEEKDPKTKVLLVVLAATVVGGVFLAASTLVGIGIKCISRKDPTTSLKYRVLSLHKDLTRSERKVKELEEKIRSVNDLRNPLGNQVGEKIKTHNAVHTMIGKDIRDRVYASLNKNINRIKGQITAKDKNIRSLKILFASAKQKHQRIQRDYEAQCSKLRQLLSPSPATHEPVK